MYFSGTVNLLRATQAHGQLWTSSYCEWNSFCIQSTSRTSHNWDIDTNGYNSPLPNGLAQHHDLTESAVHLDSTDTSMKGPTSQLVTAWWYWEQDQSKHCALWMYVNFGKLFIKYALPCRGHPIGFTPFLLFSKSEQQHVITKSMNVCMCMAVMRILVRSKDCPQCKWRSQNYSPPLHEFDQCQVRSSTPTKFITQLSKTL